MHQQEEEHTEKVIALGLGGGGAAVAIGIMLMLVGLILTSSFLVVLGPLCILGGLASMGYSLYSGLQRDKTRFEGPTQNYADVKILSRYAYDSHATLVSAEWDLEED